MLKPINSLKQYVNIIDLKLTILSPDKVTLQHLVHDKGLFSFYQDGHHECSRHSQSRCIKRLLAPVSNAWITGQPSKDQSFWRHVLI